MSASGVDGLVAVEVAHMDPQGCFGELRVWLDSHVRPRAAGWAGPEENIRAGDAGGESLGRRTVRVLAASDRTHECRTRVETQSGQLRAATHAEGPIAPPAAGRDDFLEHLLELTREFVGADENSYYVALDGDRVIDGGTMDRKMALIQRQAAVRDGEMAAVRLGNDPTAKLARLQREGNWLRLGPLDASGEQRHYPAIEVAVEGKVLVVMRNVERRAGPELSTGGQVRLEGQQAGATSRPSSRGD